MNKYMLPIAVSATLCIVQFAVRAEDAIPSASGKDTIPATAVIKPAKKPPANEPKLIEAGVAAPELTATDTAGKALRLADYKGRVVVLDYWATWCGPCIKSMPHTQTLAASVKSQNVVVLAVCTSDTRETFEKWLKANQSKYPDIQFACEVNERGSKDFDKRSSAVYGVSGIPTQFVIGTDGKIVGSNVGFSPDGKGVEELLAKAGVKLAGSKE